jgi:hypothetical protein
MGEHKTNPMALMTETIPTLLPVGHKVGMQMQLQVMPKDNVWLAPPGEMRVLDCGAIEVLVEGAWTAPPEGVEVFELGKLLPREKCDVCAVLMAVVEDGLAPKLVGANGQQAQGRGSIGPMAILSKMPLDLWQDRHLGQLRGPVE